MSGVNVSVPKVVFLFSRGRIVESQRVGIRVESIYVLQFGTD